MQAQSSSKYSGSKNFISKYFCQTAQPAGGAVLVLTVKCGYTKNEAAEKIEELLNQVWLSPVYAARYPHEFFGGQRQRIAIAGP